MFIQPPFDQEGNLFKQDAFLLGLTKRYLADDAYLLMVPKLLSLGEDVLRLVRAWGEQAEKNPPSLQNFDAFGQRIDRLSLCHGWIKLKQFSELNRFVATGYDRKLKRSARAAQVAMQIMFSAYSSTYSCPLAMTDGAIKLLQFHGAKSIKDQTLPLLLGREEGRFATCGQWMTERIGGSDLRHIETQATLARKDDDQEHYRLYGFKWFASAVDSDFALVLAQVKEYGPSLFLLPVWEEGNLCEGIIIDRLKNKMGTKGLPTAEVRLEGALATLVGPKGRGIASAAPLLSITRFYNAMASASIMNRAYFSVASYAKKRQTFGKFIGQHLLHNQVLADLDAKRCGSIALCFEIARLLGIAEDDPDDIKTTNLLRALIPLAKLCLGKWAVLFASEAIEAIGGLGYLEETEFPQLLRDAQVLPIWEGTTNIMVHDLLRAQKKNDALVILLKDLCERANALMIDEADALRVLRNRLQQVSERIMFLINKSDKNDTLYLEPTARKYAFVISTCAMAVLLAEAKPFITEADQFSSTRFTTFVENNLCGNFSL
jgi:alkylation response protein AidB-like acyl-CoA dehydrogenase